MGKTIDGIKLIRHNAARVNNEDDPSYKFRLEMICRPPEFMQVAFSFIYGNEVVVLRGKPLEALEEFVKVNDLDTHPRLISLKIKDDDGERDWSERRGKKI